MATFRKVCKDCGKVVEYDHQDELKKYFYWKSGYYMNSCKECQLKKHAAKYKTGQYAYKKKKRGPIIKEYSFGNNTRCSRLPMFNMDFSGAHFNVGRR